MKTLALQFTGIRPLVCHNSRLNDPLDPITAKIKDITRKPGRDRTVDDIRAMEDLEFDGGLYLSVDGEPVIPTDNIEACLRDGAKKSKLGKKLESSVFVSDPADEVPILYEGPKTAKAMKQDPRFVLRRPAKLNGKSRVMRIRPMFPTGWQLQFTLSYDEGVVSEKDIIRAAVDAGTLCGLGDWKPKFGRFLVEKVED